MARPHKLRRADSRANKLPQRLGRGCRTLSWPDCCICSVQAFGGPLTVRRNGPSSNGGPAGGATWLTEAGQALLPLCNNILAVAAETIRAVSDLRAAHTGRVMLAASQTVGTYVMPRLLAAFRIRNPGVRTFGRATFTVHPQHYMH